MKKQSIKSRLDPADDAPPLDRKRASKAEIAESGKIIREAVPPIRLGRPPKSPDEVKKPVSLRLSKRVLDAARATGPGWQTRAAAAVEREFLGRSR